MKTILGIIIIVLLTIIGISSYLTPNDLRDCQDAPTDGECAKADAIVAISGGDTDARASQAIRMYKQGWADTLIFAGAAKDKSGPSNAKVMHDFAVRKGVSSEDIISEDLSETTRQNAQNVATIAKERQYTRIILVTSGYHQRRASMEFERYLGSDITLINSPVQSDKHWSRFWWISPVGWWMAMSEVIRNVIFYIGGSR